MTQDSSVGVSNFEKAVLEGGPDAGKELVINRDYGDDCVMVRPSKRWRVSEERYYYYRTRREKDGRQVYEFRGD